VRQTNEQPSFRARTNVHKFFRAFKGTRRSDPILNVGFGDKQRPTGPICYSSKLIKNTGPKLRHEETFVDAINKLRVDLLVQLTA
jgi:hypothetical protein